MVLKTHQWAVNKKGNLLTAIPRHSPVWRVHPQGRVHSSSLPTNGNRTHPPQVSCQLQMFKTCFVNVNRDILTCAAHYRRDCHVLLLLSYLEDIAPGVHVQKRQNVVNTIHVCETKSLHDDEPLLAMRNRLRQIKHQCETEAQFWWKYCCKKIRVEKKQPFFLSNSERWCCLALTSQFRQIFCSGAARAMFHPLLISIGRIQILNQLTF